jgi:hypothetical protein
MGDQIPTLASGKFNRKSVRALVVEGVIDSVRLVKAPPN